MNRRHNSRHIKRLHSCDVREAAKATGATPGTVRQWHKEKGLEASPNSSWATPPRSEGGLGR
jgi:hypothetical protein